MDLDANKLRRPFWTDLRGISNTPAARAVILIPLIGYWIIFNDRLVSLSALSHFLFHSTPAPEHFPWRLFATYFGLCFVAFGSLLYQWRCPAQIKYYATATDYVGSVFPNISGIELGRVEEALRAGDKAAKAAHGEIQESWAHVPLSEERAEAIRRDDHRARNFLQAYFDLCNRSSPVIRRLAGACYTAGFFCLAIPSIDIFLRVARALVHAMGRKLGIM